ncbi:hypothetical protein MSMAC_1861 [Methanosarcina mazei C16]|uniref:Dockerin domain-containing protein n=1 Tax=Methanosarcina mazei C16 TaxID=1434113 RepID=A0A0E3RWM4_METMZ|nr:DNRLRE domain-containing protein [Methanosarcina mazei]AKB71751.1 hypothetical protein MSMAC_1861 [Methanosarcina mazei C16]
MLKAKLLSITFLVFLFLINPADSTSMNITVSEDSYIDQTKPDTNYGSSSHMYSFYGTGTSNIYPLLKFNVPQHVEEAYLHIYTDGGYKNLGSVQVRRATSDWNESEITWNNRPTYMEGFSKASTPIDSVSLPANNQWVTLNVSSVISEPANYTFWLRSGWGYNDRWISKENQTYAPYLEIYTTTHPADISWNNYTLNNDTKAFTVNTGEVIRFGTDPLDPTNISTYEWTVNKLSQPTNLNYFDYTIPYFNPDYPSTGIWEIRVVGYYVNGSKVSREWLISGLTEEQAPDYIDYFIDQNNTWRSDYIKDPWGRAFPFYSQPVNLIENGYYTGGYTAIGRTLSTPFDIEYGTFKLKVRMGEGQKNNAGFQVYDSDGDFWNMVWTIGEYHDYFAINSEKTGTGNKDYVPISRRWLGQAPSAHYWPSYDKSWHNITIIRTEDDWWSIWMDDALLVNNYLHADSLISDVVSLTLIANDVMKVDCIEFYKNRYLYPETEIRFGQYPKWWTRGAISAVNHDPVMDEGIIVFGRGLTLEQISNTINNESLITYNAETKTAVLKTNLFIKNGAELNIIDEVLLFDTSEKSLFINPQHGVTLRILNSTVSTTDDNPMIWNFASTTAITITNPDNALNVTTLTYNDRCSPSFDFRGHFVVENSTINNTCNLFMDGAHEIIINDTIFSNHSSIDYGSNDKIGGQDLYNRKKKQSEGSKAFWIVPRNDLSAYSIKNISFVDPKEKIDLKVVGGEWIFNSTTIKDSNLSDIDISTKRAYKYSYFQFYRQIYENSDVGLLNCKVDENRLKVETNRSKIKTKYYADIIVKDALGSLVQNVEITPISSSSAYGAENLYEYDGYDPIGPGEGGVTGYGTDSPHYTTYKGGAYKRWYNAQQLNSTTTNKNGRTALPSENLNNSVVLIDYVLTNETGTQLKEFIVYNLTIDAPNSKPIYLQDINPDTTWYREDPLISKYTITAIIPEDSKGPHITGFAPSTENPFTPGEKKNFRIWTDEPLTKMEWYVDGSESPVLTGSLNYTWNITEGNHTIKFVGSNDNGPVTKEWNLGEDSDESSVPDEPTQEIEFSPADAMLTRNVNETVVFSVSPDVFTAKEWYVDGVLALNNSASMSRSWDKAGNYNVTFSGSGSSGPVSHTWSVGVIGAAPGLQNVSVVSVTPGCQVVKPDSPFSLDIRIEPETNVTGAQLNFIFNSSMVSAGGVTEGDFFKQSGANTIFSGGTIDNNAGEVKYVYGFILGMSNVSTPGAMATVNLTAGNRTGRTHFNISDVILSDAGSRSTPYTVKGAAVLIDTAPVMDPIQHPETVDEESTLTFKVSAKDPDGDILTYSVSGLPQGAAFNTTSRVFTWKPAVGQAGVYTFSFRVSDGYLTDSRDVKVTVKKSNNVPVIHCFRPLNGTSFSEGERIDITVNATDADGQALSYSIRIDGVEISKSPTYVWETDYSSSGNHTIEVTVSDGIDEVKAQRSIYISDCHPRWDVNEDGVVNILDITIVSQNNGAILSKPYPRYDVNQDGEVNIQDLTLIGQHFGETVT